jgi:anti-sigma-K factor RskA
VALLQDTKPRWLVTINVSAGTMMAEPIEAEIPSGQTAELWLTPKSGNPQSLGLLDAKATILRPLPPALIGNAPESAAVSITLEPSTGSPTGAPTGAVLYRAASIRQAL